MNLETFPCHDCGINFLEYSAFYYHTCLKKDSYRTHEKRVEELLVLIADRLDSILSRLENMYN